MKVICIDSSKSKQYGYKPPFQEGDILTARQCQINKNAYDIIEYPMLNGEFVSYVKCRFISLSDINETELVKERELQIF